MNRRSTSLTSTHPLYHQYPYTQTSDYQYQYQYTEPEKSQTKRMGLSRKASIILQFALIICISAIIAGLCGGLTSKVSKWRSSGTAAEVVPSANGMVGVDGTMEMNSTLTMRGMGDMRILRDERTRRRERRRMAGGRSFEL